MTPTIRINTIRVRVLAACLALVAPIACDTLSDPLDVEPASRIPAATLETAANASLLVNGAIGNFECAFNSYVVLGAAVGEELIDATQTAARFPYDSRKTVQTDTRYASSTCGETYAGYTPLQIARSTADNMVARLKSWTDAEVAAGAGAPNRNFLLAQMAAYSGYAHVLLGEGFCTMALSQINLDKSVTFGGEIQRDSVFRVAVARFTEAIAAAAAAGSSPSAAAVADIRNMAFAGRARAKLDIGDYAGAKADAQQVPAGYVKNVSASGTVTRRNNLVFAENSAAITSSSVGVPYRNLSDPRVPVAKGDQRSVTGVDHWFQNKYPVIGSPLPLATYEEAQLIIAEAEIRANNLAAALPILNASRARGNQGAFSASTQAAYLAELIDQRRRELFLEGHHLGDIIRFAIAVQPAAGTVYHGGGTYGSQICLPLPSVERLNNPLIGS